MNALQLDLFEENSDIYFLRREIEEIKKSSDNARRGLFARYENLMKLYMKQQDEIERLKAIILK